MTDEELLRFIEENSESKDPDIQRAVERVWECIRERAKAIEKEAEKVQLPIPEGGRSSQDILNEMLSRIREEEAVKCECASDSRTKYRTS